MILFQGETVLITGASSGIGADFARQLAAQGANLILVARSEEKLNTLAESLKSQHAIQVFVFQSDLSDPAAPQKLFEDVQQAGLHVDHLINNAGFGRAGKFEERLGGGTKRPK